MGIRRGGKDTIVILVAIEENILHVQWTPLNIIDTIEYTSI